MYAIIKQVENNKVEVRPSIYIEKLDIDCGETVIFDGSYL